MILVDTNVWIALVEPRDSLHAKAVRDLQRLKNQALHTTVAVLTETLFALPRADQRQRLRFLLDRLRVTPHPKGSAAEVWPQIFDWLARYAEHTPDFADAHLCVLAKLSRARVWTYDGEFKTVWRKPDGTKIPLVS